MVSLWSFTKPIDLTIDEYLKSIKLKATNLLKKAYFTLKNSSEATSQNHYTYIYSSKEVLGTLRKMYQKEHVHK